MWASAGVEYSVRAVALLAHAHGNGPVPLSRIAEEERIPLPFLEQLMLVLRRKGLVTSQPYRSIFLTGEGRSLAQESRHRHETVVKFLVALGVPARTADSDAEGIEHHVSEETLAAFVRYLRRKPQ